MGSSLPAAAAATDVQMHDCSNDDSGLPLAKLKVEQRWTSAAAREPWEVTLVTQLSPGRRAGPRQRLCIPHGHGPDKNAGLCR